jgi:hypothetical protein
MPDTILPVNTMPQMRRFAQVALAMQIVLLALALVFYKERMLFLDAPHVLFRIINQQHLQIAEHRYGSFITQMVPLAGMWLHLPLKWLMIIYSASFNLFFLAAGLLCYSKFKRYDLVLLLALYNTLFVTDTFYWTNNEVHQGIAWLVIAFAVFNNQGRPQLYGLQLTISALLFALAIWTHPLVMLPALFLWFFTLLKKDAPVNNINIAASVLLLVLAYAKFYQGQHHGYDSGKIELVTELKGDKIKHLLSSPQLKMFVHGCVTRYWLFVVLACAGLASLLKRRAYLLTTYTAICAAGYLVLLFITYWEVDGLRFYMESEYMPLTLIACAPFVYYTLPTLKTQQGLVLLTLVFAIKTGYILYSAEPFRQRLALLEAYNSKMRQKQVTKLVTTHTDAATNQQLLMSWGTPVESMMLSQLQGERPQRTFIIEDSQQLKTFYTASRDTMLGCFEKVAAKDINARYFLLDTTSVYILE